ncbi:MAG: tRNA 5-methoxyuridine(34)/uridine 5-oxyacetic acid(34) synthase CmoB, partial [Pseudomonadota bacterium]
DIAAELDAERPRLGRAAATAAAQADIVAALRELIPWRKGPLELYGQAIDTEWASNLKWRRIEAALGELAGRRVLDVGCGNGYFALRTIGAGAAAVLGIDPSPLYVQQFAAMARALADEAVDVAPLALEDLDGLDGRFDTVLSMGVLYHRRSPLAHLRALHAQLRPGGRLLLETLVVAGAADTVLTPPGRYARMRNVWFLPSPAALEVWVARSGFRDIALIDLTQTTPSEQRRTDWMPFESLAEALDPNDPRRTVEGHPAPLRAVLSARSR